MLPAHHLPSNHLQTKYAITLAAKEMTNEMATSIKNTSFPYPSRGGSRKIVTNVLYLIKMVLFLSIINLVCSSV